MCSNVKTWYFNEGFPKWRGSFTEFIEFCESYKSLKHELGLVQRSRLLPVTWWLSDARLPHVSLPYRILLAVDFFH